MAHIRSITRGVLVIGLVAFAGPTIGQPRQSFSGDYWAGWLQEVTPLMGPAERETFDSLVTDAQRDAFVREFWRARDPAPSTPHNELRDQWDLRIRQAQLFFRDLSSDLGQVYLFLGPFDVVPLECEGADVGFLSWDLDEDPFSVAMISSGEGPAKMADTKELLDIVGRCPPPAAVRAGSIGLPPLATLLEHTTAPAPVQDWLPAFRSHLDEVPEQAGIYRADMEISFPSIRNGVAIVELAFRLPSAELPPKSDDRLLESLALRVDLLGTYGTTRIRHRFYLPIEERPDLRLAARRALRSGDYYFVAELADDSGDILLRHFGLLRIPETSPNGSHADTTAFPKTFANNNITQLAARPRLRLPAIEGVVAGPTDVIVEATGAGIRRVAFLIDGSEVASASEPPFTGHVDFGPRPRTLTLAAVALDANEGEMARDSTDVNLETRPFRLLLPEPPVDEEDRLVIEPEVLLPEGASVEVVEIYWEESLVYEFHQQPPYKLLLHLRGAPKPAYLRVVARLDDERVTELVKPLGMTGGFEQVEVDLVEFLATVTDSDGRPVVDLEPSDFRVLEEGVDQVIRQVETLENVPLTVGLLMDTSSSMEEALDESLDAAARFFDEVLKEGDSATFLSFNHEPRLIVPLTTSTERLREGLANLSSWGGTTLFDSVMLALYYFQGLEDRRALVVLTDGLDEHSRFTLEELLDEAVRSGVIVHTIALGPDATPSPLQRLAEATGGGFFTVDGPGRLAEIYDQIRRELHAQYRIAYQSATVGEDFRSVKVLTRQTGNHVRALRGYYP